MALKVKAVERLLKFTKDENDPGVYRYVMKPEMYSSLNQAKVIKEAALRSGVSQGVMQACWDAAGEVIKAWATEGHSVALPGLGTMRFGLRSKSVDDVNKVKTSLIISRRIIFTPDTELKDELAKTSVQAPPTLNMPHSRRSRKNSVPKLCQISIPLSMETFSFTGITPRVTIRSTWL